MSFEERPSSLFQTDVLAVYEFGAPGKDAKRPEERLMMAVLGDALFCYQRYHRAPDKHGQRIFNAAENWMLDDSEEWPFSFANICSSLGISPGYLRQQLVRWKANRPRRMHSRPPVKLRRSI